MEESKSRHQKVFRGGHRSQRVFHGGVNHEVFSFSLFLFSFSSSSSSLCLVLQMGKTEKEKTKSLLRHPNIIGCETAIAKFPNFVIVTELFENGSLYELLHGPDLSVQVSSLLSSPSSSSVSSIQRERKTKTEKPKDTRRTPSSQKGIQPFVPDKTSHRLRGGGRHLLFTWHEYRSSRPQIAKPFGSSHLPDLSLDLFLP